MENKHETKTALAVVQNGTLTGKIEPPAKKSEIIEAMIRRRMDQIADEIAAAEKAAIKAKRAFDIAAREAFDAYLMKKKALEVVENFWASYYPTRRWSEDGKQRVEAVEVSVSAHINLPEEERAKLSGLAKESLNTSRTYEKLLRDKPNRSEVSGEIRRAMAGEKAPSTRINAILSDPESVKVIDAALAEIRTKGDPKSPVIDVK